MQREEKEREIEDGGMLEWDNRVDVSDNVTRSMTEEEEFLWDPGELGGGVEQLSHALSF